MGLPQKLCRNRSRSGQIWRCSRCTNRLQHPPRADVVYPLPEYSKLSHRNMFTACGASIAQHDCGKDCRRVHQVVYGAQRLVGRTAEEFIRWSMEHRDLWEGLQKSSSGGLWSTET